MYNLSNVVLNCSRNIVLLYAFNVSLMNDQVVDLVAKSSGKDKMIMISPKCNAIQVHCNLTA